MPKNVNYHTVMLTVPHKAQDYAQIPSSFRLCLWIKNFQVCKLGFEEAGDPRDQIFNIFWIMEKVTELQKNINFYFTDYAKDFN